MTESPEEQAERIIREKEAEQQRAYDAYQKALADKREADQKKGKK